MIIFIDFNPQDYVLDYTGEPMHFEEGDKGKLSATFIPWNKGKGGYSITSWEGTLKSITNGKKDRRIKHSDPIPEGWYEGSCRKGSKYNRKPMEAKICITDGNSTKRIPKSDPIPNGWKPGRHYKPRT